MTEIELDLMAEQFRSLKEMTLIQFIEAVQKGRIKVYSEELTARLIEDPQYERQGRT